MESMKSLILLDCVILLGCNLQWMGAANVVDGGCPAVTVPAVLAAANADDDAPDSPQHGSAELGR